MLKEKDLLQIKNLVVSYYENKWYFPFFEDLLKDYSFLFPKDIDEEIKNQIDKLTEDMIFEKIKSKKTKWWLIMLNILKNNDELWKEFRKLNSSRFFNEEKFQKYWKEMENLIQTGENRLTEKLLWNKSMWIAKASESWYNMVYAIFPLWNKLK